MDTTSNEKISGNIDEERYFIWIDDAQGMTYGPHSWHDKQVIGSSMFHSMTDLLKMNISDNLKKRIKGAKVGTRIKLHYLHSSGDMLIMRVNEEKVKLVKEVMRVNDKITSLQIQIKELEQTKQNYSKLIDNTEYFN